jgi:hypothetical protein
VGATAQAAPPTHRPDRARARGYRNRPRLSKCPPVSPTPVHGWVHEGAPPAYVAALLLKVRLERIELGVINPQTGRPYRTSFDIREFKTLLVELQLLCRLAVGGRHGGTIVTTSFQLYKTLAEAHPSWQLPTDENAARDLVATRIRQRLYMLDACGLLAYWQDGHTDEYDATWLGRRTILQLKELPDLSDDELRAGALELRRRQRRYGRSLNTDSTSGVRNVFTVSQPLSRSEIQRRGVIRSKAAKAARAAHQLEADRTPVVAEDPTDIAHPFGTPLSPENNTFTETSTPKPSGFTDVQARERARSVFDALPARDNPGVATPGTTTAAGEQASGRAGEENRSETGAQGAREARRGEYSGLDDQPEAENGLSPYMRRLVAWQLGSKDTPIPHPGYPSPADRDDPGALRDQAAYRAVLREHPEQSRDLIRHRQRVDELLELAGRVAAAAIERNTSWTELAYTWAVIRHREFAYGEERRGCLQQAGILTRADRAKLDKAMRLYDRHSAHRPEGWPAAGEQALWHIAKLAHDQALPAFRPGFPRPACRWLADGIERLRQEARDMAAAAKLTDPKRANRQRLRAMRRAIARADTASSTTSGRFTLRYRTQPNSAGSLADTLLNYRGEIPDVYDLKRDQLLLWRNPDGSRAGLGAQLDGASMRLARKHGDLAPSWQTQPVEPRRVTVTINPGQPWQRTYTYWRARPAGVDADRLELARHLGPGTLPHVVGYTDETVQHMLRQCRQLALEAQRATSPYRFTYRKAAR